MIDTKEITEVNILPIELESREKKLSQRLREFFQTHKHITGSYAHQGGFCAVGAIFKMDHLAGTTISDQLSPVIKSTMIGLNDDGGIDDVYAYLESLGL